MVRNDNPAIDTPDARSRGPLAAMRDRWIMCVVLAIALAAAGFGLSTRHQTQFTAESRLAVGSNSLQAYQVAGFAIASQALAANYARFVSGSPATSKALGASLHERTRDITSISASPIPDSNVIRIEATATGPKVALAASNAIAKSLVEQVNAASRPTTQKLLAEHHSLTVAIIDQEAKIRRLPKSATAAAVAEEQAKLATLRLRQTAFGVAYQQTLTQPAVENDLREIQPAAVTGNDKRRTEELYTISGLLVGLLLGLVLSNLLESRAQRRASRRLSRSTSEEFEPANVSRHRDESAAEPPRYG